MKNETLESSDIDLLLETIYNHYGYDFRNYARASLVRRVNDFVERNGFTNIAFLAAEVKNNKGLFDSLIQNLSITVTDMFRDPNVYKMIRENIIDVIKTFPFLKIWHAGCATGEEVYSLAILLMEEGLYDRCQIYATDFNNIAIQKAKDGIFSLNKVKEFTQNYLFSGGKTAFSDYYHAKYDSIILDRKLKKNITFANHNLVTDTAFGEMNLIFCRNVLIYFNQKLQNKVLNLFNESLILNGFLCLGTKESLRFSSLEDKYEIVSQNEKIYRKITLN